MNTNDNRLKAHKLIDHIFQDLLPAHGMAQRPEQIQLSHRMLEAMQDGRIALCDAGTGIGKTYAYLAAATAASAFPTGQIARPIIISTSSIALQNAVLTEYLPLLSCVLMADGILTKPLKAVIRKGKSHYVCDERLDRRLRQVNLGKKNPEALAAIRTLKETLDMDRVSHLSGYDRERVCVPQVCDCKQRDCRYQRFLKTCDKNQFLFQICNHNLLVADAIHRSDGKRPIFPEHSIIIVDEAHKLPETAQQMLGVTLAAEEIRNLILQLKEERYLLAAEMLEDSTGPLLRKLAQPREEAEPVEACLRLLTAPSCTLPIIQRQIGSLLSPLGSRQLNTVLDAVKLFTSSQTDMIFYTAEDVSTGGTMLCAAADDITQRMKKILWQPDQAFVLTSGTMAVGSDFRRFKTQAGLEKGHRVMESVSPSPFDYRNNCLLYLPQIPPRQRVEDTDVYFNELTAELVGLIKAATGHALVLFTSYAAMSAVKERLWEESLPFPLLTLGRNAPHIIEQFRHTPGAVLLATGAAWEGFDFPGDCVSLLIIPRLPFAYKRVTWARNGKKRIVWRCVSRLEFGTKYCQHSPTLDEGKLHSAILAAMNEYAAIRQEVCPDVLAMAEEARQALSQAGARLLQLKKRMDAVSREQSDVLDRLLVNMADTELNARMKALTEEKESLKAQIADAQQAEVDLETQAARRRQMWDSIMECAAGYTEFDNELVRQVIQKITVEDAETIHIHFRDSDVVLEQEVE